MSIEAAAKELTKEIDRLLKEAARLTKVRDDLSPGSAAPGAPINRRAAKKVAAKKSAAKKVAPAKKSAAKTVLPASKKRTLSPEGRQAIVDATKRRWAAKRKADAAAAK